MPSFDTPSPITATVDIVAGDVHVSAGERATTTVELQPTDASNQEDVKAVEQTRVEFADGRLLVKAPKLRSWLPGKTGGSIDVTLELPAGSDLRGSSQLADFRCDGRLGQCRITSGLGDIGVDEAESLQLRTGAGDVELERATGHADLKVGAGELRARRLEGTAVVKNSNGDSWIGEACRDLRVSAANGSITVDIAQSNVVAKAANGDVRVGQVARGAVVLETALGDVEVGIREGTAAWLDIDASAGRLRNELEASEAPQASTETVEVRGRTSVGEIVVRRA